MVAQFGAESEGPMLQEPDNVYAVSPPPHVTEIDATDALSAPVLTKVR
jgi:hypothetical protein